MVEAKKIRDLAEAIEYHALHAHDGPERERLLKQDLATLREVVKVIDLRCLKANVKKEALVYQAVIDASRSGHPHQGIVAIHQYADSYADDKWSQLREYVAELEARLEAQGAPAEPAAAIPTTRG